MTIREMLLRAEQDNAWQAMRIGLQCHKLEVFLEILDLRAHADIETPHELREQLAHECGLC